MADRNWKPALPISFEFGTAGDTFEGEYLGFTTFTYKTGGEGRRHYIKHEGNEYAFNEGAILSEPMSRLIVGDYIRVEYLGMMETAGGGARNFTVDIDADNRAKLEAARQAMVVYDPNTGEIVGRQETADDGKETAADGVDARYGSAPSHI